MGTRRRVSRYVYNVIRGNPVEQLGTVEEEIHFCQVAKAAGPITKERSEFHFRYFTTSWNLWQDFFLTRVRERERNREIECWEFCFCRGSGVRLSLQFRYGKKCQHAHRRDFNDFWDTRKVGWLRNAYRFVTQKIYYSITI